MSSQPVAADRAADGAPRPAVTIDTVARAAGVSRATVSRAFNHGHISAASLERVMTAAAALGYQPNQAARGLARGRTGVVGIVLHAPVSDLQCDYHAAGLYAGLTEALSQDGAVGVMQWFSQGSRRTLADAIAGSRLIDGVVVTVTDHHDELVAGLVGRGLATVVVGGHQVGDSLSSVDIDDLGAGVAATRHLWEQGARRIGHLTGDASIKAARDRLAGYHRALDAAGVQDRFVEECTFKTAHNRVAVSALLDAGVDAIFAWCDWVAHDVYEVAAERGRVIGEDLLLVGFDDAEFAARLDPPLTTMVQDPHRMGVIAADLLREIVADPEHAPRHVFIEPTIVVRASTGLTTRQPRPPGPAGERSGSGPPPD